MDSEPNKNCNNETKGPKSTKEVPGWFSRAMFFWIFSLFYNGLSRDLNEYDLVSPKAKYDSKVVGDKLEKQWFQEVESAKAKNREPSFIRALAAAFGWSFIPGGIMQFTSVMFRTASPILFSKFLKHWSKNGAVSTDSAVFYGSGMIATNIMGAVFYHHGILYCQQFGMKLRIATSSLMFRKLMRMDTFSIGQITAAKVVNILSNDLGRFDLVFVNMHSLWIVPLQLIIVFYVGYTQAGYAAVIGFIVMLTTALPIQAMFAKMVGKARFFTAGKTDARIKLMNEVISGIQVIKMYAWEKPFENLVQEKRNIELAGVKLCTVFRILLMGFIIFNERFAIFITILSYILLGNTLSANVIYPLQQLMTTLRVNITIFLPMLMTYMAEVKTTITRVQDFMNMKDRVDLVKSLTFTDPDEQSNAQSRSEHTNTSLSYQVKNEAYTNYDFVPDETIDKSDSNLGRVAIEVKNVSASWTNDTNVLALKNITLNIPMGKLCAVIGPVGSGKSSFLELLLKELSPCTGTVSVNGKVSYASQDAWLFSSTVRDNITFGLPFEENRYKKICKVCVLEKDFQQFPHGDQSFVGERGIMLSGGQRARINLARAIYRKADIYLLDDPLSAVDANVGRQLFEGCINGYLRGRTRILVTHQVHFLKAAEYIIILNEGKIEAMGTFDDLMSLEKDIVKMLATTASFDDKETNEDNVEVTLMESKGKRLRLRTISNSENQELSQFEAQKMVAEKRESGNLSWDVLTAYFASGYHWSFITFTFMIIVISAATCGASDYWVSYWTNKIALYEKGVNGSKIETGMDVKIGNFTTAHYIIIHGCIIGLGIFLTNIRAIPFVKLSVAISNKLHKKMFSTMLRATMRFFDTNSSGRILNRFVKDVGAVDDLLPKALMDISQVGCNILVILTLNAISLYWTLIPTGLLVTICYFIVKLYTKGAQYLKRLESTTKSPVFDMVSSSLSGITTVRANGAQKRLIDEFDKHQDLHTAAWNGTIAGGEGLGTYLDVTCLLYFAIIIFGFLFIDFGDKIAVGDIGMALTQTVMMVNMLQYGVKMLVEFMAQLTSVERMLEYTKIETETNMSEEESSINPQWPTKGKIIFQNVSLRYSLNNEPVLKNLNIIVESGWKVGIVGRTGAGKTSLISALFRFAHVEGIITIDGVDTSIVSKQELRSKISIIPQDPVLFSATVRYNLDPFNIYNDIEIWSALKQVNMKSAIPSLDYTVTEGGVNFSVGQRQLMCLARAVLRSNKILIMDEATANVDPQTDNFIQQTIRRQFSSCTVLTIAHRLNTIMDADRVLVMEEGQIIEFDHPYILLTNHASHFSSMVYETGEENRELLFKVSKDAFYREQAL